MSDRVIFPYVLVYSLHLAVPFFGVVSALLVSTELHEVDATISDYHYLSKQYLDVAQTCCSSYVGSFFFFYQMHRPLMPILHPFGE